MQESLKLVHSEDEPRVPNPIDAGGWHQKVGDPGESFARLSYLYGFKSYAVLNISKVINRQIVPSIDLTNLPPDFLKHIEDDASLGECSLFQVLAQTCIPFSWKTGVDTFTGLIESEDPSAGGEELDALLMAFGIEGGFCVPLHNVNGRRSVVIYFGPYFDNSARHDKLVIESIGVFDGAQRAAQDDVSYQNISLMPLEIECLSLVASGLSNQLIAKRLDVSWHFVSTILDSIVEKLEAHNITEAVAKAVKRGIVSV